MKNFLREVFIMLILLVAIALILAIIFYDYNPMNKEIPKVITYQMPSELSDVKEELEIPLTLNDEQIIRTYELTETDLDRYKRTNYDAGKVNPFEVYSVEAKGDENPSSSESTSKVPNSTTKTENNSTATTKTDTSSTGTFFQNKFTK